MTGEVAERIFIVQALLSLSSICVLLIVLIILVAVRNQDRSYIIGTDPARPGSSDRTIEWGPELANVWQEESRKAYERARNMGKTQIRNGWG